MLYVLLNVIRNVFQKDLGYPLKKEHNYIEIMHQSFVSPAPMGPGIPGTLRGLSAGN